MALCLRHMHNFFMIQTDFILFKILFLSNMFAFFQPIPCLYALNGLTNLKQGMKLSICNSQPVSLSSTTNFDLNLHFPGRGPNFYILGQVPFSICVFRSLTP